MIAPLRTLKHLIDHSPHTTTTASTAAGLAQATIGRWLSGQRAPRTDDLNRALGLFGYELRAARKDNPDA